LVESVIVHAPEVDGSTVCAGERERRGRAAVAAIEQDVGAADDDVGVVGVGAHDADEVGDALRAVLSGVHRDIGVNLVEAALWPTAAIEIGERSHGLWPKVVLLDAHETVLVDI
jgi:hypothetical protein